MSKSEGSEVSQAIRDSKILIKKLEYLFSELTDLNDKTKGSLSVVDAEAHLRKSSRFEKTFERIKDDVITINIDLDKEHQISTKTFSTIEALIESIVKNCFKAKNTQTERLSASTNEATLPKLSLSTWDGDISTWMNFKAQYDSVVHNRKDLGKVVKFQYLRGSLKGEPLSIVCQYPPTENSYDAAYQDLVNRYENKRHIATFYFHKILNFKLTPIMKGKEHVKFIEVHKAAASALKKLGIDLAAYLLFELSYQNLSESDKKQFEREHPPNEIPTIDKLLTFVEKLAKSEELTIVQEATLPKGQERGKSKPINFKKTLVISKKRTSCYCCQGEHSLHSCPKILELPVGERKQMVEQLGCCVACLYKHPNKACASKFACKICGEKKHNTILHQTGDSQPNPSLPSSLDSTSTSRACNNCTAYNASTAVVLGTVQCQVQDSWGNYIPVRAIMDPGSEISVITSSLSNRLGLPKLPAQFNVEGVGQRATKSLGSVRLTIHSNYNPRLSYQLRAAILPSICNNLPHSSLPKELASRFQSVSLADPYFYEPGRIQMLLGADVYSDLLSAEEPAVIPGNPSAVRTKFGYVIIGRVALSSSPPSSSPSSPSSVSLCLSASPLEEAITRFWKTEEILDEIPPDPNDVLCERHFCDTHERDETGRFVVRLPFLPNATPLGNNKEVALKRLYKLEQRLRKNPDLAKSYENCIKEYIDLGHISISQHQATYLLPHHSVLKESSSTTKCRVVFDCSALDDTGVSLNDRLYRGPPLLDDISSLLMNFRFFRVCVTADIKMMYRMVSIHPSDRRYLVIAWRDKHYQMNRLPFGLKPAGYIAGRCLVELSNLHENEFPLASAAIRHNRYADDFCAGAETPEEAKILRDQLSSLLAKGGFEIRRWSSNHPEVLSGLPESFKETPVSLPTGEIGVKVLGVMWDQNHDAFVVNVLKFDQQIVSRRTVLSYIARIFDVMGLFCPTIFLAKHFMQRLWLVKTGWDDPLPANLEREWREYADELTCLSEIKIPRLIPARGVKARLVGFSDASEKGMAAAVYVRLCNDERTSFLLRAKSKLAPLKTLTIPRLELCAALLLSRLVKNILGASEIKFESINLFTDSKIVLSWLAIPVHELKIFVSNRISQILNLVPTAVWSHVISKDNPADLGSRGVTATRLSSADLWWHGPQFLVLPFEEWPEFSPDTSDRDHLPEMRSSCSLNVVESEPKDYILRRFSSLTRMQRVLAYMRRFVDNSRRCVSRLPKIGGQLSVAELNSALLLAIKISQSEDFGGDIHRIKTGKLENKQLLKLSPFFDEKTQAIRVGGRLKMAHFLPEETRHPFLLSKHSHLSMLICDHYHKLLLHAGPRATCAGIQRKFWIISATSLVKKRIHRCVVCHRLSAKPKQPIMADVPLDRMRQTFCWASCSLDFGGPFLTRESKLRKNVTHKSYMCVFVCLTTRAIHLEMVTDLTSAAFIAAFHRFTARRSVPNVIYSDQGTNFVGAKRILQESREFLINNRDSIFSAAAAVGTRWMLNVPYGPNFNGCAENGVKSAKALIKRQVGELILTFEEFMTLLCRVEQILNSRPISFSSNIDDQEIQYLTPGHFITGRDMLTPPEEPIEEGITLKDRWRRVSQMSQTFWKTWSKAYLHELMQRKKWTKPIKDIKVGDLVYVTGLNTTPLSWPIGRVEEVFPNPSDSTVRVVRVRSRGRDIIRPVNKLVTIPTDE